MARRATGCGAGSAAVARRLSRMKAEDQGVAMKFVVCLSRENCGEMSTDDLTLSRVYEVL
jgi:hypothetical protein